MRKAKNSHSPLGRMMYSEAALQGLSLTGILSKFGYPPGVLSTIVLSDSVNISAPKAASLMRIFEHLDEGKKTEMMRLIDASRRKAAGDRRSASIRRKAAKEAVQKELTRNRVSEFSVTTLTPDMGAGVSKSGTTTLTPDMGAEATFNLSGQEICVSVNVPEFGCGADEDDNFEYAHLITANVCIINQLLRTLSESKYGVELKVKGLASCTGESDTPEEPDQKEINGIEQADSEEEEKIEFQVCGSGLLSNWCCLGVACNDFYKGVVRMPQKSGLDAWWCIDCAKERVAEYGESLQVKIDELEKLINK